MKNCVSHLQIIRIGIKNFCVMHMCLPLIIFNTALSLGDLTGLDKCASLELFTTKHGYCTILSVMMNSNDIE